ncbi:MAG: hypothetical protein EAZ07_00610 [Cytophagales bacterium]|nr:MAG: hypothetical protein EAZ07_00610 [Cytophagales bacterium]
MKSIKSILCKPYAKYVVAQQQDWMFDAANTQKKTLKYLLEKARDTQFGKAHRFHLIKSHQEFVKQVPIRDYESLKEYVHKAQQGIPDVLWPGLPLYLAKTSGTTSGFKYIPITKESIGFQIAAARDALLNYVFDTKNTNFLDGNLMFLSGSPELKKEHGIWIGRLSGIVNHHIPSYLKYSQLPSYKTNCISDWESKIEHIIDETIHKPMSLISGIPPWVQMYFDRIQARIDRPIKDIFPQFSLYVFGGVNFEPYKKKLFETIGKSIDNIETFPASEGFFAFQNVQSDEGLLLLLNSGIYYEFVPVEEINSNQPTRLSIAEVELDKNYAMIISTNAGLWAYSIGDTVKFVSKNPYKIIVTGRVKHFISAFGEHVIGEEVERALKKTLGKYPKVEITEFTVAPYVASQSEASFHEWLIEFANPPENISRFAEDLDNAMVSINSYYSDLIIGKILNPLTITRLQPNAFIEYMKSEGKLGGQNKVPRLTNDRKIAQNLSPWKLN